MSSRISNAAFFLCVTYRYFMIHSTRWSLKTPLISWWSRSGASNSWMSARGNECVNGYTVLHQTKHQNEGQYIPQCCAKYRNHPRELIGHSFWCRDRFFRVSVDDYLDHQGCSCEHRIWHMHKLVTPQAKAIMWLTLDTSGIRYPRARLVQDSRQCMAQAQRLRDESAHRGTSGASSSSYRAWVAWRPMRDSYGKVGDKIFGILVAFAGACLLECGPTLSDSNRTKIIKTHFLGLEERQQEPHHFRGHAGQCLWCYPVMHILDDILGLRFQRIPLSYRCQQQLEWTLIHA